MLSNLLKSARTRWLNSIQFIRLQNFAKQNILVAFNCEKLQPTFNRISSIQIFVLNIVAILISCCKLTIRSKSTPLLNLWQAHPLAHRVRREHIMIPLVCAHGQLIYYTYPPPPMFPSPRCFAGGDAKGLKTSQK